MNASKILVGALAGLAAGAVIGILFAPDKGSNTRKKLSRGGNDVADQIEDKFNELLDSLNEKFDATRAEAADLMKNANTRVTDLKNEVNSKVDHKV